MLDLKMLPQHISVEGINGCGKTTFLDQFQELFDREGIPNVRMEMMPAGPLRDQILGNPDLTETMRLLLIRTLSLQVQRNIKEALQDGKWVLTDRGWLSYLVYQGQTPEISSMRTMLEMSLVDPFPKTNFTIFLDVDVETALKRRTMRSATNAQSDHFETGIIEHETLLMELFLSELDKASFVQTTDGIIQLDGELSPELLAHIAFDMINDEIQENYSRYLENQHG